LFAETIATKANVDLGIVTASLFSANAYKLNITTITGSYIVDTSDSIASTASFDYLIVAGGGAGASGGGGAGGLLTGSTYVHSNSVLSVVVGLGGIGGLSGGVRGGNGGSSSIALNNSFIGGTFAVGGGGGGGYGGGGTGGGAAGGSGGGANVDYGFGAQVGGAGTAGQGFAGGSGGSGGAGGGARQAGSTSAGGNGALSSITGTPTYYAGGGGVVGGLGGGGSGPTGSGTNGLGGGGGCRGGGYPNIVGGNGGSGVVIFRSLNRNAITTGSPTITYSDNYTVYKFTQNGTITFPEYDHLIVGNNASTPFTLTMISASLAATSGREILVKNKGAANMTIDAAGGLGQLDGADTFTLRQYQAVRLVSDGSTWNIL
jgi:hypothetical protein